MSGSRARLRCGRTTLEIAADSRRETEHVYDELFTTMYRTAMSAGLPVHDSSDVFDQSAEPYFIDVAHLNEAGNRRLAARSTEIALVGSPVLKPSTASGRVRGLP